MLPDTICELLNELSYSLQAKWKWSGAHFQGLSVSRTFPIEMGGSKLALRDWGWGSERIDAAREKLRFQQQLQSNWMHTATSNSDTLLHFDRKFYSTDDFECPIPNVWMSWARGEPIAIAEGSIWSLASWKNGITQQASCQLSQDQITDALVTLARMHAISMRYAVHSKQSEGWLNRAAKLNIINDNRPAHGDAGYSELLRRSAQLFKQCNARGLMARLQKYASDRAMMIYPCCWIVRDSHRSNWLFDGNQVAAFVDFAAAGIDWFGWDVVRFLLSCGLSHAQFELSLQTYIEAVEEFGLSCASMEFLRDPADWSAVNSIQLLLSINQWSQWSATGLLPSMGLQQWQMLLGQAEATLLIENGGLCH